MATRGKKPEPGVVERLSKRGEEAFNRLADELGRNERFSDALGKALSAKGRLDTASRRALGQVGLAAAEELRELRAQIERMEKRLAKLESASSGTRSAKRSETKKTATARKRTTTRVKAEQEKAPSPPPGRALGGGSGRGSSAS